MTALFGRGMIWETGIGKWEVGVGGGRVGGFGCNSYPAEGRTEEQQREA